MVACFSAIGLLHALIWFVVICFVVFCVRVILPHFLGMLGVAGGVVSQILNALAFTVAVIVLIYLVIWILECARF